MLPLVTALAVTAGCAHQRASQPPEQPQVVALDLKGTDQVKASDIKEKILTTKTPWWQRLNPFGKPSTFDPNTWQADLKRIVRYYQAQGFYGARIESSQQEPRGEDKVALEVVINEGAPTLVAAVEVSGLEELPDEHRKKALEGLPVKQGEVFREEQWAGTQEQIQARLHELGYAEAEVGGEVRVDLATQGATVDIRANPGPRYRFGNIFVATDANPQVNPRRIIEQAQGSVKKGEWFTESALSEAQARVFRMGVFGAVKVNRGAPDREARTVPVVVDVREAPFRSVRAGGGIGLDAARQEIRVLGEWTHRNFLGGLRKLTLTSRVGYAFIPNITAAFDRIDTDGDGVADAPNETTPHGPIFQVSAQFEQPRFLARDLRLQTSLTAERGLEQAYNFIGGRARAGVVWQPRADLSLSPTYNLELYNLRGQRGSVDQTTAPALVLGCRDTTTSDRCNISVSYLEQFIELNRRNDSLAPTQGYYASLSFQEGGKFLGGDYDFVRVLPDVRGYYTFGPSERFTLAARLRLGTLLTSVEGGVRTDSAIVNRFFSGGGASMRGFNSRRLSPMNVLNLDAEQPSDRVVPVGGNSLVETSVEVRARLISDLSLAVFHDSGLTGSGALTFGPRQDDPLKESGRIFGDYHYQAVGLGLRYNTVVGPIRLDVARRLNIGRPLPIFFSAPGQTTTIGTIGGLGDCFGLGVKKQTITGPDGTPRTVNVEREYAGAPEGLCTFFLSIGEAF
ncbi:autotransporter assembly complex protein TamA [Archangium primigenium]|uniref:autotransporter assembly complex protein TamA n=1 Tax=[Archangium] primigenium TaxID=2792470 RepID=UPI00195C150C|nr:BamA/TamA family outer membrane protein [Archangium primigenium]MBM7113492.1 BamA/TamA family outer membrane protein [Archangium primigenium]